MDQLKVCSKCKESKAHSEFNKSKSRKDGLQYECKVCKAERQKNYYKANSEYRKEQSKNWARANLERTKEISKAHEAKYREINSNRPESYFKDREGRFKYCPKCNLNKPLIRFSMCKSAFDGFSNKCNDCNKNYYKTTIERRKENNKSNIAKYKDINKNRPESYFKDREGRFKYCPTCDQNKSLIRFSVDKLRLDGFRSQCMDCANEYFKQRRKTDIQFRLRGDLRNTTSRLINLAGKVKEQSTEEIIDAEFTEAENILLDQMFKEGYTIEQLLNGELELDHKQPLAWFDLTNEDEYREAGHISNLHYILKEENQKKGDRYAHGPNNEIILHEEWLKKRQVTTISH